MKRLALITTSLLACASPLSAGELQNLRAANAEQKRQITALEKEIDNLYSLLEKEMRKNKARPVASQSVTKNTKTSSSKGPVYIVKGGDTLSKIAREHQVSLSHLMNRNRLTPRSVLQIGQRLTIPGGQPVKISKTTEKHIEEARQLAPLPAIPRATVVAQPSYKVKQGDTFYSIARQHGVKVSTLSSANPSLNPSRLRIGQAVLIPGKAKTINQRPTTAKAVQVAKKKNTTAAVKQQSPTQTAKTSTLTSRSKTVSTVSTQLEPIEMKAITLPAPITLQGLADKYDTTVEAINALNRWSYRPTIKLAKGSEIYLPN